MKKSLLFAFFVVVLSAQGKSQNIAINTDGSSAHTSALLDVKSTTKGMLVPRMTSAQRTVIASPANGLMVYDTDTKTFWYFNGIAWTNLAVGGGGGGQLTLPFDTTVSSLISPFTVRNTYGLNSVAMKGENLAGYGVYGSTSTGKGIYGYATSTGNGVEGYSSQGIGVRGISGSDNAIHGISSGTASAGVKGDASALNGIGVYGTFTGTSGYGVRGFSANSTGVYGQSTTSFGVVALSNSGVGLRTTSITGNALEVIGKLKIMGAAVNPQNGAVLTSDVEGNATWKLNRVAFRARGAGGMTDETTQLLNANVEEYDYSFSYSTATGMFTAPVTGVYSFGAQTLFRLDNDLNDNIDFAVLSLHVIRNGVALNDYTMISPYALSDNSGSSSWARAAINGDLKLQAGDIVKLNGFTDNTANTTITWSGIFFGHLVFAE